MPAITLRPAKKSEVGIITELNMQASGGIVEFLLSGLMPNSSPKEMMHRQISSEEPPYSYRFVTMAELNNEVVGIAHYYPSEYNRAPNAFEKAFIPFERTNYILTPMYQNAPKNTLYLHALAVFPKYQGLGVGKKLLDFVKETAKQKNQSVTLHAWRDNHRAIALYEHEGFRTIEHANIARHPLLPHDGGMLHMQWSP